MAFSGLQWTYAQDAFWEWFQSRQEFTLAQTQIPQSQGSGLCAVCGRETEYWIKSDGWKTFTDWSVFRSPGGGLCRPCWVAKHYGRIASKTGLAIGPQGQALNGRSYSLWIAKTTHGIQGAVPWSGSWWELPTERPLVAQIVWGDRPSRQHWLYHAIVSANEEIVALLVNGEIAWVSQQQIVRFREWVIPVLNDVALAKKFVPDQARPVSSLPWARLFYDLFPPSPVLSLSVRSILGGLVKRHMYLRWINEEIGV